MKKMYFTKLVILVVLSVIACIMAGCVNGIVEPTEEISPATTIVEQPQVEHTNTGETCNCDKCKPPCLTCGVKGCNVFRHFCFRCTKHHLSTVPCKQADLEALLEK